jgi:hypothetical protein
VTRAEGLFPAPLPPSLADSNDVIERFHFLGVFVAKCLQVSAAGVDVVPSCALRWRNAFFRPNPRTDWHPSRYSPSFALLTHAQDNRLVALPLSAPLLRWMCGRRLTLADLALVLPASGAFLLQLQELAQRRNAILTDETLCDDTRALMLANLKIAFNGQGAAQASVPICLSFDRDRALLTAAVLRPWPLCWRDTPETALEDLCIPFVYLPSSKVYGFFSHPLWQVCVLVCRLGQRPQIDSRSFLTLTMSPSLSVSVSVCLCLCLSVSHAASPQGDDTIVTLDNFEEYLRL